ncbi:MAG: hypothetical protein QOE64_2501 [Frankiales bacterium]|jgi:hypothetical protein|nr:hypothetical protein [Frankiales bacterium]
MTNALLYAHILSLLILIMNAGAVHLSEVKAATAGTVAEARSALRTAVALGPVFGIGSLLLVVTGLSLAHAGDNDFDYGSSWIVSAFIALVIINAHGAGRLGPRAKRLADQLAGDGPLSTEQRALTHDKQLSIGGWFNTAVAMGIVLLMVAKPAVLGCVITLVVAAVVGLLIGLAQYSLTGRERAVTA